MENNAQPPGQAVSAEGSTFGSDGAGPPLPDASGGADPSISDFEMIKRIGRGSYGQVWLARSATGSYRAIKVVHREAFEGTRPYEREFEGIRQFEPLSRAHPGQLDILHVGREDEEGYFYYVMELADDASVEVGEDEGGSERARGAGRPAPSSAAGSGIGTRGTRSAKRSVNSESYHPLTLHERLQRSGRLRFPFCLEVAISLAEALEYLHANDLVHRDIKPANIVFVRGRPKLADIGLVAKADARVSIVGTEGFLPPEGPGKAQADLYSLGKVFYEMATGKDRRRYPEPPDGLDDPKERKVFLEFNEVLLRCCEANAANRYQSTSDLLTDLHLVRQGRSVRRLRMVERKLAAIRKVAIVAALAVAVLGVALWQVQQARQGERESNERLSESVAELNRTNRNLWEGRAVRAMNGNDFGEASLGSVEALQNAEGHSDFQERQRIRIAALLQQMPRNAGSVPVPEPGAGLQWFELSEDGTFLLVTAASGVTELWDVDTLEMRVRIEHRETPQIRLSPDSRRCCTFGDTKALLWDLGRPEADPIELPLEIPNDGVLHELIFLQGGKVLVTGFAGTKAKGKGGGVLVAWDPVTGEELSRSEDVGSFRQLLPHPSKPWFLHVFGNPVSFGNGRLVRMDEANRFQVQKGGEFQNGGNLFLPQTGGWFPFSSEGNLLLAREVGENSEVGRVAVYRLSPDEDPVLVQRIETVPNRRGDLLGGGFLPGERDIWLDFEQGVVVIDIESGQRRSWFSDPLNNGRFRPEASRDGRIIALNGDFDTAFLDGSRGRLFRATVPFGMRSPLTQRRYKRSRVSIGPEREKGRLAAFSSPSGSSIQLIDLKGLSPQPHAVFEHPDEVESVAFSPDGRLLLTGCADQVGRLWDLALGRQVGSDLVEDDTGVEIYRFRVAPFWVGSGQYLAPQVEGQFRPEGDRVLLLNGGRSASLWSARAERVAGPFAHDKGVHDLAFSQDGRRFLVSGGDGLLRVLETADPTGPGITLRNDQRPYMEQTPDRYLRSGRAAFHPSRPEVVVVGRWREAVVWNWEQPDEVKLQLRAPGSGIIYRAEYTADGSRIVTLSFAGRSWPGGGIAFQVWDAESGDAIGRPFGREEGPVFTDFLLSPAKGESLLYAFEDFRGIYNGVSRIVCWDLNEMEPDRPHRRWTRSFENAVRAALSPDGTRLAAATRDGVQLLDASSGMPLSPPFEVSGRVIGLALAADNRTVAVGCADGKALVWRFGTDLPAGSAADLAQYHSWRTIGANGLIEELNEDELRRLKQRVAPLPDGGPSEIDETVEADRVALRKAVAAGARDRADALFQRLLDGLEAKAEVVERGGESGRAIELRRVVSLGRLIALAQATLEFEPGDPVPGFSASTTIVPLVSRGAAWRYFDRGVPADDWTKPEFDDAEWSSGNGPLGFGDDQKTALATKDEAGVPLMSACFRYRFRYEPAPDGDQPTHLVFGIQRDDGAVVYLNGHELLRTNMPEGAIEPATSASRIVGVPEETMYRRLIVDARLLQAGENLLAVEVHQENPDSSDLTFDLELQVELSSRNPIEKSPELLATALSELLQMVPPAYGDPWREGWDAALAAGPESAPGTSSQAAAFRERVQALLAGEDPAVLAFESAIDARSDSFDAKSVRQRKDLLRRLESRLAELGRNDEAAEVRERLLAPPPRDPDLDPRLIDLTPHFQPGTSSLYDGRGWHESGRDLRMLGETFDQDTNGPFDIRGIVQLNSGLFPTAPFPQIIGKDVATLKSLPLKDEVSGIAIGRRADRIHFLHGECFGLAEDGTEVARYRMHFADGGEPLSIPVLQGHHVVDWRNLDPLQDESVLAWTFNDEGTRIGVTKMTWENPHPERGISHLDFVSAKAQSAPFLLAVTVE